jgi:acylglycerol lipase
MAIGEQLIRSDDGTGIHVTQYHCKDPKAQVLLLHGYLEHSKRYKEFAEYLNLQSISATVFDLRGHGSSGGDRAYLDDWEKYHSDLEAVRSTLLPSDKLPTFLLGHSTGGLIILDYILRRTSTDDALVGIKVILISPYTEPSEKLNPLKKFAARLFGAILPNLPIPAGLTAEELTSCPQKQQEHKEDRQILAIARAGWAAECMNAQERVQKLVETVPINIPLLFIYGDEDPVACPKINEKVAQKLQSMDKTILRRKGEKHELLNEIKRKELFEVISKWILKKASSVQDHVASKEQRFLTG